MKNFRSASCIFALLVFSGTELIAQTSASTEDGSIDQLSQQADAFRKIIASLETDAAAAQASFDETQQQLASARSELADLEDRVNGLRTEEAEITARLESTQTELNDMIAEKASLSDEVAKLRDTLSGVTEDAATQQAAGFGSGTDGLIGVERAAFVVGRVVPALAGGVDEIVPERSQKEIKEEDSDHTHR